MKEIFAERVNKNIADGATEVTRMLAINVSIPNLQIARLTIYKHGYLRWLGVTQVHL